MVQLLQCEHDGEFTIRVDQLLSLADVGIEFANFAMRDLDKEYVTFLVVSDPKEWPPVLLTLTDRGYVLIDGRHRKEATIDKNLDEIRAVCRNFKSEQEIVEAAFEANIRHGLRLTQENRSDYVYVLHRYHPDWKQKELALQARVRQSTVSEAISSREKKATAATQAKEAAPTGTETPAAAPAQEEDPEQKKKREAIQKALKDTKNLTRGAAKILEEINSLDEREQREMILDAIGDATSRQHLLELIHLLEKYLEPSKRKR